MSASKCKCKPPRYRGISISAYLSNEYPDWKPYLIWGGDGCNTVRFLWGWFSLYLSITLRQTTPEILPVDVKRREKIKKKNKPYRGASIFFNFNNQRLLVRVERLIGRCLSCLRIKAWLSYGKVKHRLRWGTHKPIPGPGVYGCHSSDTLEQHPDHDHEACQHRCSRING